MPTVWALPDIANPIIKIWPEDALVFVEGPSDTHHIDLPTAHILSLLSSQKSIEESEIREYLNSSYDTQFDQSQVHGILSRLQRMRLVEQIANGSASE